MAKILFSNSYFYRLDKKQWNSYTPYPPLGTLYAISQMKKFGYDIELFDTNLVHSPNEIESKIISFKPDYLIIYDDCFNYLTKMCLTVMRDAAFELIKIGKKNNCKIIVSSSDATDHIKKYLEKGADFVISGEAEITIKELVNAIENKEGSLKKIDGIAYLEDEFIVKTKEREKLADPDQLTPPSWELIDIMAYKNVWKKSRSQFTLNIVTTRGCPFHCTWCAKPVYGYGYNSHSAERVVSEISLLMNNYNVQNFWFCDDIFALKYDWLVKFREIVLAKNLKFNYIIQSRADILLKENTIEMLAESGLKEVWLGAESGSQKILDKMNKGIKIEQVYEAIRRLKQKKIKTGLFLQFGYLGEKKEDILLTLKMLEDLIPDNIGVSISYPLPGTVFHEQVRDQLKLKSNWVDSDDLSLMYKGTFHPDYYKKLHRYVHKLLRRLQAIQLIKQYIFSPLTLNYFQLRTILLLPYYIAVSLIYRSQLHILEKKNK